MEDLHVAYLWRCVRNVAVRLILEREAHELLSIT